MALESKLSQTEQIVEHLGQISQHLAELNSPGVHEGLLLAIIGAFSAFMFNLLYWRIVRQHSKFSKAADSIVSVLSELDSIAVPYWLEDASDISEKEREFQEIKIVTLNRLLIKSTENLKLALKGRDKGAKIETLAGFQDRIFDLSTGDDFASVGRVKNSRTANRIAFECIDFRLVLENYRS